MTTIEIPVEHSCCYTRVRVITIIMYWVEVLVETKLP